MSRTDKTVFFCTSCQKEQAINERLQVAIGRFACMQCRSDRDKNIRMVTIRNLFKGVVAA